MIRGPGRCPASIAFFAAANRSGSISPPGKTDVTPLARKISGLYSTSSLRPCPKRSIAWWAWRSKRPGRIVSSSARSSVVTRTVSPAALAAAAMSSIRAAISSSVAPTTKNLPARTTMPVLRTRSSPTASKSQPPRKTTTASLVSACAAPGAGASGGCSVLAEEAIANVANVPVAASANPYAAAENEIGRPGSLLIRIWCVISAVPRAPRKRNSPGRGRWWRINSSGPGAPGHSLNKHRSRVRYELAGNHRRLCRRGK